MAMFTNQSGSHNNGVASYTVGISDDRFTLETIDNELYVLDKDYNPLPINDYNTKKTEIDLNYNIPLSLKPYEIYNVNAHTSSFSANNRGSMTVYFANKDSIFVCNCFIESSETSIGGEYYKFYRGERCSIFDDIGGNY